MFLIRNKLFSIPRAYNSVSNATAVGNEGAYTVDEKISKCDKRGGYLTKGGGYLHLNP